jgi:ABC-2 type transport system ATP-binding protein
MIRVRDLRVDYDTICAVRDLSLEVAPGQVCGLIGPNGAGKTTTMLAILGLIEPTYGTIELAGVDMRERPRDACRAVGFMPDFPPMYDDLQCWEFLDLFAASYSVPRAARPELIDRCLSLVGLTEKRQAMIVELSRGMRQRLMLAKTLIPDPQVLMLDEPASGLDPQGRIDLKNVLKELAARGKTVLISSHILAEMSEFCTAVAIMERGRMVVSGAIAAVQEQIMGGSVLLIEVLGDSSAVEAIVASDALAGAVEHVNGSFAIPYRGDAEGASALLAALVQGGVKVASFTRRREGLEELFLKVGARELS